MNKTELKELAINYYFDRYYFDTIEEYIKEYEIETNDIKMFKFYVKIEFNKRDTLKKETELKQILNNCISFKAESINNDGRYIILHPSTRPEYKYQLSYFDQYGAYMDERCININKVIDNYIKNYNNYKIVEIINNMEVISC